MNLNNIALLIRKDILSVTGLYGNLWYSWLIWLLFIVFMPSMLPFIFVMMVFVLVISLFQNEENDLVCNVSAILPIRRRDAVLARYLYMFLVIALQILLALAFGGIGNLFRAEPSPLLYPILAGIVSALVMCSINIPLIYRFGVVKSRMVIMVVLMVMIMGTTFASEALVDAVGKAGSAIGLVAGLGGALVLTLISLVVSIRIQR